MHPLPFAFELGRPVLLGVVLLGLLVLAAVVLARAPRGRKLGARDVPRALLALVCALAAGEPRVRDPDPPRTRIVVVDRSASFAPARASLRAALERAGRDLDPARDRLAAVAFGARPVLASGIARASEAGAVARAALEASVDPAGSDVGAALDLALETAREAGGAVEVVLISDGADTGGRARAAAEGLAAAGVVLHAVSPPVAPPPNARVSRIDLPPRAAVGEAVRVHVDVETTVRSPVVVSLELEGAGAALFGESEVRASAEPGSPARVAFEVRAAERGLVLVRARARLLAAPDEFAPDDVLEASFVAGERARAILVAGPSEQPWRGLLEEAQLDVELATPERLAAQALDPARGTPSLVVLDEVPASALGPDPVRALERLVEAGAGLLVAGCDGAFGPGGYPESPIDGLLPVRSGPPGDPGKPFVLELVLDASGSMGTPVGARTRFLAAIDAVVPRARELRKHDLLGIVLFSETPHVQRALAPLVDERLLRELKAIEPDGGTDVAAGLVRGLEEVASREGRRLLVLVTDGEDKKVPEKAASVHDAAVRAHVGQDLEVALVLVGDDAGGRATLETLARACDPTGQHARTFAVAEAGPELGRLVRGIASEQRSEKQTGTFVVLDERGARLAAISSYAPVEPRPLARTVLSLEDPARPESRLPLAVLAPGRSGATVALATGLGGGGAGLARSPAGRAALVGLIQRAARPLAGEIELHATRYAGEVVVEALSRDPGRLPAGLVASWSSVSGGAEGQAPLDPRAPGVVGTRFTSAPPDALLIRVSAAGGPVLGALVVAPSATLELAPPARDLALLGELAALTGDERGVAPEPLAYPPPPHPLGSSRELAPWLALAALVLLVAEGSVAVLLERLAARRAAERAFAMVAGL